MSDAEHFTVAPDWKWYILVYFFLAGIAGGSYLIGTLLRLFGGENDRPAARIAFIIPFPLVVICPFLLILDLGSPSRFWHMLIDTTPGHTGPSFVPASPMSLGVWTVTIFGGFAAVAFIEAVGVPLGGVVRRVLSGAFGAAFHIVGAILGLFVASYTGVLLAVGNEPVWSDTWTLGGLFLVSGLSAATVTVSVLTRRRASTDATEARLAEADGYFALLEVAFIVLFWITLARAGALGRVLGHGWIALWIVVGISLLPALAHLGRPRTETDTETGSAPAATLASRVSAATPLVAGLVLLGVFALRAVIIFSAQG